MCLKHPRIDDLQVSDESDILKGAERGTFRTSVSAAHIKNALKTHTNVRNEQE
jgi:hypothetical protein